MPLYSGESIEITASAEDFDGVTSITPTLLGSGTVTVEIIDSAADPWVSGEALTWDDVRLLWYFLWQTADPLAPADTYQAKVTVTGADGTISFAYTRIGLKAPPF